MGDTGKRNMMGQMIRSRQMVFLGLLMVICSTIWIGCSSSGEPKDVEDWNDFSFGSLSYKLPPGWVPVQKKDSVVYTKSGTPLHNITIERFRKGDQYPNMDTTIDTELNRFELAERTLQNIKSHPDSTRVTLLRQQALSRLGDRGYLMKVRIMNTQGLNFIRWILGAAEDETYYRITVEAEEYGHYSKFRETFSKFLKEVKLEKEETP